MKSKSEKGRSKEIVLFILIGLFTIIVSEYFEERAIEHSNFKTVALIAGHLGIGLFAIGCLGMLFERKHWTDYFEDRLKGIVSHPNFIEELSEKKLQEMEINVVRSHFRNKSIGATEGIFDYYKLHLQPALNKPYRSKVEFSLNLELTGDFFIVTEKLSWNCMCNNGTIQQFIHWEYGEGEIEEILESSIRLQHQTKNLDSNIHNPHKTIYKVQSKRGFKYPLSNLNSISIAEYHNLYVEELIVYKIRPERMITWSFSHLSKDINIIISYPDVYDIFVQPFLIPDPGIEIQSGLQSTNPYKFSSDSWFMEDDGIAFQFIPKNKITTNSQQILKVLTY